jgi:hypothetical protein
VRRVLARAVLAGVLAAATAAGAQILKLDVGRNTNPTYEKECGSCHFPYQPGWLPERSWRRMMGSLASHFGENAVLSQANHDVVLAYLVAGAADKVGNARSREVMQAVKPGETPQSITKVLYVGGIHGGFLDPAFKGKPEVKTLAQCPVCHKQADRGWFAPVTYTITDESFRRLDWLDPSLNMPMPSFLRPK